MNISFLSPFYAHNSQYCTKILQQPVLYQDTTTASTVLLQQPVLYQDTTTASTVPRYYNSQYCTKILQQPVLYYKILQQPVLYKRTPHTQYLGILSIRSANPGVFLEVADQQFIHCGIGVQIDKIIFVRLNANSCCLHRYTHIDQCLLSFNVYFSVSASLSCSQSPIKLSLILNRSCSSSLCFPLLDIVSSNSPLEALELICSTSIS